MEYELRLAKLRSTEAHQIQLRTLQQDGWTIAELCDLIIEGVEIPAAVRLEIEWGALRAEWIFARRTDRSSQRLEVAIGELSRTIGELKLWLEAEKAARAGQAGAIPAIAAPVGGQAVPGRKRS